jgi:hypothetical protein
MISQNFTFPPEIKVKIEAVYKGSITKLLESTKYKFRFLFVSEIAVVFSDSNLFWRLKLYIPTSTVPLL